MISFALRPAIDPGPPCHYSVGVRAIFILLVLANIAVFALGQGWFGAPRSQAGRTPADRQQALINPDAVRVAPGQLQNR